MKKNFLKIVTIGGGSSYTPELIEGFIKRYNSLPIDELWLVDIEEGKEKLEIITNLAKRMVKKANLPIKIFSTLDRKMALKDATFVTTQLRVGLLPARILDEKIPISYGIIGQETVGAGGMFKAFRTIPVIFEIIDDMKVLCPDAWLINFTNPSGIITEAIAKYANFNKAIGLCNVPINMVSGFAKILKADEKDVTMTIEGLNHFIFATNVLVKGESRFNELLEKYATITEEDAVQMKNFVSIPFSESFIKGLNAIPCPYHNYYFYTKEQLEEQLEKYKKGKVRGEEVYKSEKSLFEIYKNENLNEKPEELSFRGGAKYSDAACNLIDSIYNNKGDTQYVNVKNNGAIFDLPKDSVVEIACKITNEGPKPIEIGNLNPKISGYIKMLKTFEELVVEAAIKGDRNLAITALNLNPLCSSDKISNLVVNELIKAHKKHLPQFK